MLYFSKGETSPSHLQMFTTASKTRKSLTCIIFHQLSCCERSCRFFPWDYSVRFIFSKYRSSDSPSQLMAEHNVQFLQLRRKIHRLKFLFLLSPEPYITPLTARRTRHRHAASLTPYNGRTSVFMYSFFPRTVTEWNRLPYSKLVSTDSIASITI